MRKVAGEDIVEAFVKEKEKLLSEGSAASPEAGFTRFVPGLVKIG